MVRALCQPAGTEDCVWDCFGLWEAANAPSLLGDERLAHFCQHENTALRFARAAMRHFCRSFDTLSCLDQNHEGEIGRFKRKGRAVHRKGEGIPRWRHFVRAGLIALGAHLCLLIGHASAGAPSSHSVRALAQRESKEAGIDGDTGDAKHFAERLKHHQRRHFTKQRREFRKAQLRLESQRRLRKARMKARQFAAARRHATQHAPKHKTHTTRKTAAHQRSDRNPVNSVGNLTDGLGVTGW